MKNMKTKEVPKNSYGDRNYFPSSDVLGIGGSYKNQEPAVGGSSPPGPTEWACSSVGRAPA